jgi:hypothetical protein
MSLAHIFQIKLPKLDFLSFESKEPSLINILLIKQIEFNSFI